MEIEGDYRRDGYALVKGIVPRSVARLLIARLGGDLPPGPEAMPANLNFAEGLIP